jgi:hypothetical protein
VNLLLKDELLAGAPHFFQDWISSNAGFSSCIRYVGEGRGEVLWVLVTFSISQCCHVTTL